MRSIWRNHKARVGLIVLAAVVAIALIGPHLVGDPRASTALPHQPPSSTHLLGTTGLGQDVLAQTVVGVRSTLAVGFAVGSLALVVSLIVGLAAGYARGRLERVLMLATDVFLIVPGLPLAIVVAAFLPPGPLSMCAVLVLTGWAWNARVLRAQTMTLARRDCVRAAVVSGESTPRIMLREILPNMASLVASCAIGATVYAIGAQVGLEFIGLGDPGRITWGTNLYWAANDAALITGAWWTFVPTGLGIAVVGFALTLVSFGIDEVTNPRLGIERRFRARTGLAPGLGLVQRARCRPGATGSSVPAADGSGGAPDVPLAVRDLRVTYLGAGRPALAVDGVSLDLRAGEILGLAGESGSGKSTLAGAVLRILRPPALVTGGTVHFAGDDVLAMDERALRSFRWRQASMVFQSAMSALNPMARVVDQIVDTIAAHQPAVPLAAARDRAAQLIEMVGLAPDKLRAFPHQLSGGQRQRVVIAIALALTPRVLIMDEPTTALDVVVQREILDRVATLTRSLGLSVLLITHDLPLLLEVADRIGVMYAGELVELAPASAIASQPRHPYTRGLLRAFPPLTGTSAAVREIAGSPPSLAALPPGCRFQPRCPLATAACATEHPRHLVLSPEHQVACFLVQASGTAVAS